jgi:transcriptional regulator of acetoin/glycerol metabolism
MPEAEFERRLFGDAGEDCAGPARSTSPSLLRAADGGTLFLDQIGDMSPALQTRLLRALQQRESASCGERRPIPLDVALVCASQHDLGRLAAEGGFRQDLFYRIAPYRVDLPPLRNHRGLGGIVDALWRRATAGDPRLTLRADTRARLLRHDWPGNYRELAGALTALAALSDPDAPVAPDALPVEIRRSGEDARDRAAAGLASASREAAPGAGLDAMTLAIMQAALDRFGGNVSRAARDLGVNRSTFYRRLGAVSRRR